MTKRAIHASAPGIDVFVCGITDDLHGVVCSSCKCAHAVARCSAPLAGRKTGMTCNRALCRECLADPNAPRCPPHRPKREPWDPAR